MPIEDGKVAENANTKKVEEVATAPAIAQPESKPTQTTNQQHAALTDSKRQEYRGIISKNMFALFDVKVEHKDGRLNAFILNKAQVDEKHNDLQQLFTADAQGKRPDTDGLSPEDKLLVETAYNRMERVYATLASLQTSAAQETTVSAQKTYATRSAEYSRSRLELMLVQTDAHALFNGKSFSSKDEIEKIYQDRKEWIKTDADALRPAHANDAQLVKDVESKILRAKHEAFKPTLTTSQKIETAQQTPPEPSTPTKPIQIAIKEYPPTQTANENVATTLDKPENPPLSPTQVYDERYKKDGTYTEGHSQPTVDSKTSQTILILNNKEECKEYMRDYRVANPNVKFDILANKQKPDTFNPNDVFFDPVTILTLEPDEREILHDQIRNSLGQGPKEKDWLDKICDAIEKFFGGDPKKDDPTPLSQSKMSELPNTCNQRKVTEQYKSAVGSLHQNNNTDQPSHTGDESKPLNPKSNVI